MFSTHSMKYIWYSPQKSKYPLCINVKLQHKTRTESYSPAQNQFDLGLWYKFFLFTDSCRLDIAIKDSG